MKRIDFLKHKCIESGRVFDEVYACIIPNETDDPEFDDIYQKAYNDYMNEDLPTEILEFSRAHSTEIAAKALAEYISRDIDKEIIKNIKSGLLLNP